MKTAKIWASAVFVGCPECLEQIESPDGSLQHDAMNKLYGKSCQCPHCAARFRLPADYTVQGNRTALGDMRRTR